MFVNLDAALRDFAETFALDVPRAGVGVLNDLAFSGQRHIRDVNMPAKFDLTTDFIKSGVEVEQAAVAKPSARVGTKDFFMDKQEEGRGISAAGGKKIAIPLSVGRDARGMILPRERPKALLARAGRTRGFMMTTASGKQFIVARGTDAALNFKYLLKDRVFVPKRFFFAQDMETLIFAEAEGAWQRRLALAL